MVFRSAQGYSIAGATCATRTDALPHRLADGEVEVWERAAVDLKGLARQIGPGGRRESTARAHGGARTANAMARARAPPMGISGSHARAHGTETMPWLMNISGHTSSHSLTHHTDHMAQGPEHCWHRPSPHPHCTRKANAMAHHTSSSSSACRRIPPWRTKTTQHRRRRSARTPENSPDSTSRPASRRPTTSSGAGREPECAVYTAMADNRLMEALEDYRRILAAGVNVVASGPVFLQYPWQ